MGNNKMKNAGDNSNTGFQELMSKIIDSLFDEVPEIDQNIDAVKEKLEDSKKIIDNALREIENQRKQFEELKREAEISRQISSMNKEQMDALSKFAEIALKNHEKRTFPKTTLWNLFFCILSAILGALFGFLFGRYFPLF